MTTITSKCPGCGATLLLDDQPGQVTCNYCGTHFEIKMDDVNPTFRKTESSTDYPEDAPASTPQIIDGAFNPPAAETSASDASVYNPPIPGEAPVNPADLYNPPIPNAGPTYPSQPYSAQSFPPPPANPPVSRFEAMITNKRMWILLAIIVFVIFCVSCLCMIALVRGVH